MNTPRERRTDRTPKPAMPCHDTQALRSAARTLAPPFRLALRSEADCPEMICHAILRHLPGKRLVCAGICGDRTAVVAKIFLAPSGAERHFRRELLGIQALQAAHIPTPALLFQGKLADGLAPLLLFRHMEGFENLLERLATIDSASERTAILKRVVAAIARLHAAGLKQRDIHPGNFLLSEHEIAIIDGDDIEKPGQAPLPARDSLSNLALFFAQFYPAFDAMVPPLIDVYIQQRQWPSNARTARTINAAIRRWRAWRLKNFLPKTRRSCTDFMAQKSWHRFVACDRKWYTPARQPLLENPDVFIRTGTVLKAGNSATVAQLTIEAQPMAVKRYNIKNWRHALQRALRPSRAMVSWKNAHRLQFMGIATPQPLAVIEERWGLLRKRAYFIMAYIEGQTLDQALCAAMDDAPRVNRILDQLEGLLNQLAAARISHGDFKATNFLFSSDGLYLVDLDGMRAHRYASSFQKAFRRDLKRLVRNWQHLPQVDQQQLAGRLRHLVESVAR